MNLTSNRNSNRQTFARSILVVLAITTAAGSPAGAQTAISADGLVESTSGGFMFPDGSVQTTAVAAGAVPDTGQQGCWSAFGGLTSCVGTGQDGELQRGLAWPAPRFTDKGNGTVTDNLTDLIWLQLADCFGARTWAQALTDANTLMSGTCGLSDGSLQTDWRLPNIRELLTLVDYAPPAAMAAVIPSGHPFTSVQLDFYWSSTSFGSSLTGAWGVNMANGDGGSNVKTLTRSVWPVKGGQ